MSPREARRDMLFDYAVRHPAGFTNEDVMADEGWSLREFNDAVRDLRLFLGGFDDINLPCDPTSGRDRWVYRLVGNLDDARGWITNRLGDTESRIRTQQAMMASIVTATDGRTSEGRKARVIETALRHLVEDLDNLIASS